MMVMQCSLSAVYLPNLPNLRVLPVRAQAVTREVLLHGAFGVDEAAPTRERPRRGAEAKQRRHSVRELAHVIRDPGRLDEAPRLGLE